MDDPLICYTVPELLMENPKLLIQKDSHLAYGQVEVGHDFQILYFLDIYFWNDSHGHLPIILGYVLDLITKRRNAK